MIDKDASDSRINTNLFFATPLVTRFCGEGVGGSLVSASSSYSESVSSGTVRLGNISKL